MRNTNTIISILIVLLALFFTPILKAQNTPEESFTIHSEYMKSEREILVALPKGYNKWTSYDVQYMLDPNWNMERRYSLLKFMQGHGMTPKTILVGIVSPDRNSDMLPTHTKRVPTSGNAANFVDFITKEVKPFIEEKYKTTGHTTFGGHSFGGVCVMYTFLKSPKSFDAYLVGDPSFWYDDDLLMKMAKTELPKMKGLGKIVFIGGRKGSAYEGMGISRMEKVLKEYAPDDLAWKIIAYEDETHNSVSYKLNYDGIKFISQDYRNNKIKFIPEKGEVVPGVPLAVFLQSYNKEIRYTVDGTEPNFESEPFTDSVVLTKPAVVKIKIPLKQTNLRPAVKGEFKEGIKNKGIKNKRSFKQGLRYKYYEGDWKKLPKYDTNRFA